MKGLFLPLLLLSFAGMAATVDTVSVYSSSMKKSFNCVVVKPDAYKKKKNRFPVVYLLHGYSGGYADWIKRVPALKQYADDYGLLIVCPDGGYSSWYFDSPVDPAIRFETYIAREVTAFIGDRYRVIPDRKARAITGLSMGGHGGLFLGFRHADYFGACGSMSGGVNLYDSRNRFDISKRLGDTLTHADNWNNYSVLGVVETAPVADLNIIIDCGTGDFFFEGNRKLHQKLLSGKIPHDYIERPGGHDWNYWTNAIQYQLLFFKKYFDQANKKR